jgi:hypothetical protein
MEESMFKVLYAPFEGEVKKQVEQYTLSAYSALVWESSRRIKVLTINMATSAESQARISERYEAACECLDTWPSLDLLKEMLRSIYYTNEMGAEIREEERRLRLRPKPFFYSFKGHGGHGVDAWD